MSSFRFFIQQDNGTTHSEGGFSSRRKAVAAGQKLYLTLRRNGVKVQGAYVEKETLLMHDQAHDKSHPSLWDNPDQIAYYEDIQEALAGGCSGAGCTHDHSTLIIHSSCHFKHPTITVFFKDKPYIMVACDICNTPIAFIAVAKRPKEGVDSEQNES